MMTSKLGRLLSRRETFRLMGGAGVVALTGWGRDGIQAPWVPHGLRGSVEASSLPGGLQSALFSRSSMRVVRAVETLACVARPAQTEGPYFVDELLNRSDIRPDPTNGTVKAGVPLYLNFSVNRASGTDCAPLAGAVVDIWHCDALGAYSDTAGGAGQGNTSGQKYLRGYQVTDSNGAVQFTTIYPGYYTGRTVHIHFKIRLFNGATRTFEFTSQLYFDDTLTDQVFTLAPYNAKAARGTRNGNDGIYSSQVLLGLTSDGQGGYVGNFDIGLSGVPDTVATVTTLPAASLTAGPVASEAIAALFGAGLAGSTEPAATLPLPTTLAGVQVLVQDSGGTQRVAPLFYVSPSQINFQVPLGTSTGSATVTVSRGGVTVGQGSMTVAAVAPGLFAANSAGQGVVAALALRVTGEGVRTYEPIVQFDAAQGRYVGLAIDLGPVTDQVFLVAYGTGFRNRSSLSGAVASIGGAGVEVGFAGAQGYYAGLDQVNILLPRSLAGRGELNLVLNVDGVAANTVTINVK